LATFLGGHRRCEDRQGDIARGRGGSGSLIRHASSNLALTIGSLTVSMIKPPFGALLMAAVGGPPLLTAGLLATAITAVLLPTITTLADPEDNAAFACAAKSLTQNNFSSRLHPRPKARLDNSHRSWQPKVTCLGNLEKESCRYWTLAAVTAGVSSSRPSEKRLHEDDAGG